MWLQKLISSGTGGRKAELHDPEIDKQAERLDSLGGSAVTLGKKKELSRNLLASHFTEAQQPHPTLACVCDRDANLAKLPETLNWKSQQNP